MKKKKKKKTFTDFSKKEIEFNSKRHGYDIPSDLSLSTLYKELAEYIKTDLKNIQVNIPIYPKLDANQVKKAIELFEVLGIKLQEVDIIDEKFDISDGYFKVTQEFVDAINTVHPSMIPLKIKRYDKRGFISSFCTGRNTEDPNLVDMLYQKIILPNHGLNITQAYYNHEITHSQLEQLYGSYTNILNGEMLPILIEYITSKEIDKSNNSARELKIFRLKILEQYIMLYKADLTFKDKIERLGYISSIIKSIKLSNLYCNSYKKEICNYINQIFSQNKTVEDMLSHFEIGELQKEDFKQFKITK